MPTKHLSRRTVLRGALATGAALSVPLPILEIMLNSKGTAFAQGTPLPKRYCTRRPPGWALPGPSARNWLPSWPSNLG
jgi:hypothetical protein